MEKTKEQILKEHGVYIGFPSTYNWDVIIEAMQAYADQFKDERQEYDPNFGDQRKCNCGHDYYRHFDTYDNMSPIGCKYCMCSEFQELKAGEQPVDYNKMPLEDERQKDVSWLKELIDIRNKLYNQMPASGEIDAWAMVHVVKSHINDIDVLCSRINSLAESGGKQIT